MLKYKINAHIKIQKKHIKVKIRMTRILLFPASAANLFYKSAGLLHLTVRNERNYIWPPHMLSRISPWPTSSQMS